MGNKVVRLDVNIMTLTIDGTEYRLTPGHLESITNPRPGQWKPNDFKVYKSLVVQTKVKSFPNRTDATRPHATWKWKHMLKKMVIPRERIVEEESEDTQIVWSHILTLLQ